MFPFLKSGVRAKHSCRGEQREFASGSWALWLTKKVAKRYETGEGKLKVEQMMTLKIYFFYLIV